MNSPSVAGQHHTEGHLQRLMQANPEQYLFIYGLVLTDDMQWKCVFMPKSIGSN